MIEQAIFTSAKTDRAQGYQLLGRSPGLAECDVRELSVWGPSHGSLLDEAGEGTSANFFKLGCGSYCVSRTTVAGAEYSGRGGAQVYTQFLVLPPEVFARFANNPFAVLRAAAASGALCVHESVPERLEPLTLGGHAPVVDLPLMAQLACDPGASALATLVQAALASDRLAMFSETPCELLIAGLFNVLPVECRAEFSFTTGLKFSPSRSVRISSLPAEESSWRSIARRGFTLLRIDGTSPSEAISWEGWAAWVAATLSSGKLSLLTAQLEQERPGLTCADLHSLSEQFQETMRRPPRPPREHAPPAAGARREMPTVDRPTWTGSTRQRADAPHVPSQAGAVMECNPKLSHLDALADKLAQQPPEVLELLERIDDLVFGAISGDDQALTELVTIWPTAAGQLEEELVERSREQYLRCALSICTDFAEDGVHRPERALAAIDVLCVLFEE